MNGDPWSDDGLDIPSFLLVKNRRPENPELRERLAKETRKVRRQEKKAARASYDRPKTWTPEAAALEKQLKAKRKADREARFKALREKHPLKATRRKP